MLYPELDNPIGHGKPVQGSDNKQTQDSYEGSTSLIQKFLFFLTDCAGADVIFVVSLSLRLRVFNLFVFFCCCESPQTT